MARSRRKNGSPTAPGPTADDPDRVDAPETAAAGPDETSGPPPDLSPTPREPEDDPFILPDDADTPAPDPVHGEPSHASSVPADAGVIGPDEQAVADAYADPVADPVSGSGEGSGADDRRLASDEPPADLMVPSEVAPGEPWAAPTAPDDPRDPDLSPGDPPREDLDADPDLRATEDGPDRRRDAMDDRGYGDASAAEETPSSRHASDAIIPMLVGGILAALIGFFAARYLENRGEPLAEGPDPAVLAGELSASIAAQDERIAALQATIDDLAATDIAATVGGATEPMQAALSGVTDRLGATEQRLTELSDRVETIALRPEAPGLDPGEFDQALTDFRAELRAAIETAQAQITQARAEAEEITDRAFASEQAAAAVAAWQQVTARITAGDPYADELAAAQDRIDAEIPAPVEDAANDGIATLAELQDQYAEPARAALRTSIRTTASSGGFMDRAGAFLRVQSGVRSLSPRDGDDPDAVLSRAEAAVARGDVPAALDEIAALPPEGQNALRSWVAAAERRVAVLAAADTVTQQLGGE